MNGDEHFEISKRMFKWMLGSFTLTIFILILMYAGIMYMFFDFANIVEASVKGEVVFMRQDDYSDFINKDRFYGFESNYGFLTYDFKPGADKLYGREPLYFCVETENRSLEDIMRTTTHELAHYFSMVDYEHFCVVD